MNDDNVLSFQGLINETLKSEHENHYLEETDCLIETIEMKQKKSGFYTVVNKGVELDIPLKWGAFEAASEDNVVDLLQHDMALNSVFEEFFNKKGVFKLIKNERGMNVVYAPKIKKAA